MFSLFGLFYSYNQFLARQHKSTYIKSSKVFLNFLLLLTIVYNNSNVELFHMKINVFKTLPKECYLAFSGGIDSVVLLDVLLRKKISVTLLVVDHNTEFSKVEVGFCKKIAKQFGLEYKEFNIPLFDKSTSLETFWSRKRNDIFQSMDKPVMTGHHLSDATEWYMMTSCQGSSKLLNYNNQNVFRPFITTSKNEIIKYANHFGLKYLTDPTNNDTDFNLRNKVRHNLLPIISTAFPGLEKTIRKLIMEKENPKSITRKK